MCSRCPDRAESKGQRAPALGMSWSHSDLGSFYGVWSPPENSSVMPMMRCSELTSFFKKPFRQMETEGSPRMNTKSRGAQLCQRPAFKGLSSRIRTAEYCGKPSGMQHHLPRSLHLGRNYPKITFTMTAAIAFFYFLFSPSIGLGYKLCSLH